MDSRTSRGHSMAPLERISGRIFRRSAIVKGVGLLSFSRESLETV
jgi:hypothetical protein